VTVSFYITADGTFTSIPESETLDGTALIASFTLIQ
jgi:hypothetical protein